MFGKIIEVRAGSGSCGAGKKDLEITEPIFKIVGLINIESYKEFW